MSDSESEQKLGGDLSFDQLMKEAVALKSAQLSRYRPKFDSWPEFHQAGLYYSSNWTHLRQSDRKAQCDAFDSKKNEGVTLLSEGDPQKALYRFEEALCVFRWVESRRPNWKNEGIEDDDLTVHEAEIEEESVRVRVLSAYLNISLCCMRLNQSKDAVKACDEALTIDPDNVKALYRKAVSLAEPSGSDIDDYREAIKLLTKALQLEPNNATAREKLLFYKSFVKEQKVKSKETFGSFFRKPILEEKEEVRKPVEVRNEAEELLAMGKQRLRELKAENRRAEAKELRAKLKEIEKWKKEHQSVKKTPDFKPDFTHPTEAMKKEAERFGLDLEDPQVQEALTLLQKQPRPKPQTASRTNSRWLLAILVVLLGVLSYYYWSESSPSEDFY